MPNALRMAMAAAAVLLMPGGAALADEQRAPAEKPIDGATVSVGIICDTAEQAERYAELRVKGEAIDPAAMKVNAEAHDPRACGIAAIAYFPDATVATRSNGAKLLKIVRVNVIAGYNGSVWHSINGEIQYAVIEAKGVEI